MALYSYKKAPVKYRPTTFEQVNYVAPEPQYIPIEIKPDPATTNPLTLWDVLAGFYYDLHNLLIKSRIAGFLVPLLLIIFGANIIYTELWPDIEQQIKYAVGFYDVSTVPLVAGDYVERAKFLSNPGSEYFAELADDANTASILQNDPFSNNYNGRFSISIPSLELNSLPVQANVDSGVKEAYDTVLNNGLAHFAGTGLPVSPVKNNIVVYGHSSSGDYFDRTGDIAGAFSRLNKIKLGDEIIVNMEGKTYKFRVYKSKIVSPDDISIVTGIYNKRTLTVFTCFPNGNSANRFVAIAKPVEDF